MKMLAIAVPTVALAMALPQNPPPPPQQTFRTGIDVVHVDASVRRGNTPVTGLTPADFELTDNGVRQEIESVVTTAVPIDLSVVVDVSGNPDRPWTNLPPAAKVAADVEAQARRLTGLLRDGDRVRLLTLDTYVRQIWPLQPASELPAIRRVTFDGLAGLYTTLATALLQPVDLNRRHVIVGVTRGHDNSGLLTAPAVRALAEQSDAQLHLVMNEMDADEEVTVRKFQCGNMDLCRPTARFVVPSRRRLFNAIPVDIDAPRILFPDGLDLKAGAEASGGGLYQGVLLNAPSLHGTFAKAFQDFRQSYVLRYAPRGVAREGWHRVAVRVPKQPGLKVRARSGYAVEAPRESAPPLAPLPSTLRSLDDFVTAYERGAYPEVAVQLQRHTDPGSLINSFDRRPSPWPAAPRREAAFVLEVAEPGLFSTRPEVRDAAVKLLQRFELLQRPTLDLEPDVFERAWLTAELAILQATVRPPLSAPFIERALSRFPHEPRFLLARAIVADQRTAGAGTVPTRPSLGANRPAPPSVNTEEVIGWYEAAAAHALTRAEALMRLGWLLHRLQRDEEALARLKQAASAEAPDSHVRYLRDLLTGQVLLALSRPSEAIGYFRRANGVAPNAQSARVALMGAMVLTGDRAGAESMAEAIQTAPSDILDPWWLYWMGLYREYPESVRRLRTLTR